jgi:hypothetical protein
MKTVKPLTVLVQAYPCFLKTKKATLKHSPTLTNNLLIYSYFIVSSQAELLHYIGEVILSITGINHWWIGLSDIGEYKKCIICICAADFASSTCQREKV